MWSARSAARTYDVELVEAGEMLAGEDVLVVPVREWGLGGSERRGSACRHFDVRGSRPHVGDAQVGAPHLSRRPGRPT